MEKTELWISQKLLDRLGNEYFQKSSADDYIYHIDDVVDDDILVSRDILNDISLYDATIPYEEQGCFVNVEDIQEIDFEEMGIDKDLFDEHQIHQIIYGIENGLDEEKIKLYADCKFNGFQMYELREAFENDLTIEQVKVFADIEFDQDQMKQIHRAFINELSDEEISIIANPKFNSNQMYIIRTAFESGWTIEEVDTFARPEIDSQQMYKMFSKRYE